MCFDHDSRPPIAPIAGGALDSRELTLTAADGNRLTAFQARAADPTGAGDRDPARRSRPPRLLRGARAAVRRERRRRGRDRLVRPDGRARPARRGLRLHAARRRSSTWAGMAADIRAGRRARSGCVRAGDAPLHDRLLLGRPAGVPVGDPRARPRRARSASTARRSGPGAAARRSRSTWRRHARPRSSASSAAPTRHPARRDRGVRRGLDAAGVEHGS